MVHRKIINHKEHKVKARKEHREDSSFVNFVQNFVPFVVKMYLRNIIQ
jgi:hypothetical protein